jgi:transcriptional regulator GlxA family with amidase domain
MIADLNDYEKIRTIVSEYTGFCLGAQCSGTLMLAKLGILGDVPACTDSVTKPWVQDAGIEVLNQPLFAKANVATAGGCLSSAYLSAWVIAKLSDLETAKKVLHYFAPMGEKDEFVENAVNNISLYLYLLLHCEFLSRSFKSSLSYNVLFK